MYVDVRQQSILKNAHEETLTVDDCSRTDTMMMRTICHFVLWAAKKTIDSCRLTLVKVNVMFIVFDTSTSWLLSSPQEPDAEVAWGSKFNSSCFYSGRSTEGEGTSKRSERTVADHLRIMWLANVRLPAWRRPSVRSWRVDKSSSSHRWCSFQWWEWGGLEPGWSLG